MHLMGNQKHKLFVSEKVVQCAVSMTFHLQSITMRLFHVLISCACFTFHHESYGA